MHWIKEEEMVDSVDDLKSSCSKEEFKCRFLKYSMRGLLQHGTESSIIPASKQWMTKNSESVVCMYEIGRDIHTRVLRS